jgi:hypothetical protein
VAAADFLYLVYFDTAFSAGRAWSIWSYAYVAVTAVVIWLGELMVVVGHCRWCWFHWPGCWSW